MKTLTVEATFPLKEVMARLGMSQRKLCKLLGRPPQSVRRYYRGQVTPGWDQACRIAAALGVPVGTFCKGDPAYEEFFSRKEVKG